MDDVTKFILPLPEDPALLKQMIREQEATVLELLKQRDAARQGQADLQEQHGELEHEHGELQRHYEELQSQKTEWEKQREAGLAGILRQRDRRIAELEKQREELTRERDQKIADLELERLRLAHQLALLKKQYYGPRSDRVDLGQLLLEFAQELEARPVNPQDLPAGSAPVDGKTVRRVKRGRRRLADLDLPTVRKVHDLTEAGKLCSNGHARVKIGEEITYQIERAPGFFYKVEQVQIKYGCAQCDENGENPQITLAEKPLQPIEKGMAGPGLLAYVVTSKFADYLPLYRLENIFARAGFEIDRSTMCVWAGDVADLIKPVYDRMVHRVLQSHVIGTDDTIMPMLEIGKCRPARMWVYRGDEEHPYNVFDFTLSRSRDGPAKFLGGYQGTLLADAYGGYDGIAIEKSIVLAGCWAHGRRKLVDSHDLCPEIAGEVLVRIRRLFAIEEPIKGAAPMERLAVRQEKSVPVLAELHELLLSRKEKLLPKHPVAQAMGYLLNQWKHLIVFARDGAVDIDNNLTEQEMKRQAINRKNSLFVGNERGGRTAARLSSITSTCRRHGVDPQFYFTQLLTNLPKAPMSEVDDWLPDAFKRRGLDPAAAYAEALSSLRR
jgi:transposase